MLFATHYLKIRLCVENNNMFIQKILRNVLAFFELNIVSVVHNNIGKKDLIVDFNGVYLYTDITHASAY